MAQSPDYDPLTGLHGRQWMLDELTRVLAPAGRPVGTAFPVSGPSMIPGHHSACRDSGLDYGAGAKEAESAAAGVPRLPSLILLDLDHFKLINGTRGYAVGDQILSLVAERIAGCVSDRGRIARLGGDEFAIIAGPLAAVVPGGIPSISPGAATLAEAIAAVLDTPFDIGGSRFVVTASMGIVPISPEYCSASEVLRDAEIAMYRAKSCGRNRWESFDISMREEVSKRMELETELRTAVRTEGIRASYQPIVRASDGVCVGFEALARWPHAEFGLVMPGVFIPLAEESSLILELGRYMIRVAARQIALWKRDFPDREFYVSVNLSPFQIRDSFLIEKMVEAVVAAGASPRDLALELTESAFLEDPGLTGRMIDSARKKGFRVFLDDFGSGYSTIRYLKEYRFDAIKIDRHFLEGLGEDARTRRLLELFSDMAGVFGTGIIVEGVEEKRQLELLSGIRIDAIQGDYFSKPVDEAGAIGWLSAMPRAGFPAGLDILCRVVDNYGDIGVVYRLARALSAAKPGINLRLIVDDLSAFARLAPGINPELPIQNRFGWTVAAWTPATDRDRRLLESLFLEEPPRLVVECFACGRPDWYEEILFDPTNPETRHIVNLEYLSAEAWADEFHRMNSLTRSPLVRKYVFMPGFTAKTGGLIIDSGFAASLDDFRDGPGRETARLRLLQELKTLVATAAAPVLTANAAERFWITVFSYERDFSRIVHDLAEFSGSIPTLIFVAEGRSQPCFLDAWEKADRPFPFVVLPFLPQETWDRILVASDFSIVRGEESLARAALAGRPFLWHAYVQEGRHQLVKVGALLGRMRAFFEPVAFDMIERLFLAFNDRDRDSPESRGEEAILPFLRAVTGGNRDLAEGFSAFSRELRTHGDLAAHLLTFFRELL